MFSSVENSPPCITRVASHKVGLLRFAIGKVENLSSRGYLVFLLNKVNLSAIHNVCIVMVVQYKISK